MWNTKAATLRPNRADDHYWLGIAMMESGGNAGAAKEFQRVLQIDPKFQGAAEALEEAQRLSTK